jgi:predicted RNA-binding Zn ribbon-like protein
LVVTKTAADLELAGGNLALDLANTRDGHAPARDYLQTPDDLVAWSRHAAGMEIAADATALRDVLELRETVDAVFRAVAAGDDPDPRDLQALTNGQKMGRLVRREDRFELVWDRDIVGAITAAAIDLLRHGPLDKLKQCEACPWLFLDLSRNHSRRWCSMNVCGGTLKMRRYRARARRRSGSGSSA